MKERQQIRSGLKVLSGMSRAWLWFGLVSMVPCAAAEEPVPDAPPAEVMMDPVTFDAEPGKLYVPLTDVTAIFGWVPASDLATRQLLLNGNPVAKEDWRRLVDGTALVSLAGLENAGATVNLHPSGQSATIEFESRHFTLMRADKRVEVSLGEQKLRAWQGSRLILETKVSTGRSGRTPSGSFNAGPYKSRMHRSRLYHNAPMPWSVQVNGHVFIHGFTSVPDYPASHGCVRVPLTGGNPARFFYEWVDAGTPVQILPVPPKKPSVAGSGKGSGRKKS